MAKIGGDKGYVQKRTPRESEWTKAKRARFLDVLAATCNVAEAARAAGMTARGARGLRRRDGAFALLWADAFALGQERLREELVGVALAQICSDNNPSGERAEVATGPFDPALAIKVLQLRASDTPARRGHHALLATPHDVDAALLARFDALDKRAARKAARAATRDAAAGGPDDAA